MLVQTCRGLGVDEDAGTRIYFGISGRYLGILISGQFVSYSTILAQ
jgi:hypothetical protein